MIDHLLTTGQAAVRIGVSRRRVLQYIRCGRLAASRYGRDWLVPASQVQSFERRPPGRRAA
jgi:excisionase family DNA binding protein